jgi:RNA 2',3'-cyclic 3'-phosphodiesterase
MPGTIRIFIAVPIPDALEKFLGQVQAQLQSLERNIRWVATKNIHLTLKFLGEVDPARIPAIASQMDSIAGPAPPFAIRAAGVGVFPNVRHARVVWVGLAGDIDRLKAVQAGLESGLEAVGFNREARDLHPHLTIGRTLRRIDSTTVKAALEPLRDTISESFRVDRLTLYKSKLNPAGAEYTPLYTAHLSNRQIR